jgi:hypothetical protein
MILLALFGSALISPGTAVAGGGKPGIPPAWVSLHGTVHATTPGGRYASYHNGSRCVFHHDPYLHQRSLPYTCSGPHFGGAEAYATYRIFVGRATRVYVTSTLSDLEGARWTTAFTPWTRSGRYITVRVFAAYNSGAIKGVHVALRWD